MASRTAYSTWTPQKPTLFDGHYLRNRSTFYVGQVVPQIILGYDFKWGQGSTSNDARTLFQMRSGQYLIWDQVVPQIMLGYYFKWGQGSTSNEAMQYLKWLHNSNSNDASEVLQMGPAHYFNWDQNSTSSVVRTLIQMSPEQYLKWGQNFTSY